MQWRLKKIFILSIFALLLFSLMEVRAEGYLSPKKLNEIKKQYGQDAYKRVQQWMVLLRQKKISTDREKLTLVNQFFNRVHFISDLEHWHKEDYWATPLETLISNGGDCEDFSVAKYFTLTEMGINMKQLRLTYVKSLSLNQAHMVLSYFPLDQKEPLILDNLIPEIKPASQRKDLLPVYSFNGKELWIKKEKSENSWIEVGKSSRIRLWENLLSKYSSEMINSNQRKTSVSTIKTNKGVHHEPL